ncbi:hypothetical protein AMATHDRAFT_56953 [Amanita thiersii Skay4041]|uniref:Uncharacterized protein n=1 Tax=Amanita thiersii Skay4041 TaxID=703135 RepID=A0A2A9NQL7_9AGAR|nr:hypothetical protein AMATHDRAFT_56953 [Amanita thiersii Skay4041]
MVHVVLSSPKGNQGLRYFPHSGYLGLTPVKVEGVVGTRVDAEQKILNAKSLSVSVRCYETRHGRINILQSNLLVDYTQVLWSKGDEVEYEAISNMEFPFEITLPVEIAGFSTCVFVDYRCVWRVEAVLEHTPIYGVGNRQVKHFELPLIRYDVPPLQPVSSSVFLHSPTHNPKATRIRYCVHAPTTPIGPLDFVSIPIHLQPLDSGTYIRGATLTVERRIQFNDIPTTTIPQQALSRMNTLHVTKPARASLHSPFPTMSSASLASYSSLTTQQTSNNDMSSTTSLLSRHAHASYSKKRPSTAPGVSPFSFQASSSPKAVSNLIAGTESSGHFAKDSDGIWHKTLVLHWPAAKSHSRWAIGETIQSNLVSVKFFVRVKIVVSSPSGVETIELEEKELLVVSTNETERQSAINKYNEITKAAIVRSASKSPRRPKKDLEGLQLKSSHVENDSPKAGPSTSTLKRPHTSVGPSDKMSKKILPPSPTRSYPEKENSSSHASWKSRSDVHGRPNTVAKTDIVSPKLANTPSGSSSKTATTCIEGSNADTEDMREWEAELTRIEMRSRRSSDFLRFFRRRKRSVGGPVPTPDKQKR